jgi:hypothetical protein
LPVVLGETLRASPKPLAFRIGGGLLLGLHVRLTAVADSLAFVMDDESESALQGALLAHISYQTN